MDNLCVYLKQLMLRIVDRLLYTLPVVAILGVALGLGQLTRQDGVEVAPTSVAQDPGSALSIVMVDIAGGEFVMGSTQGNPAEQPARRVRVLPFQLSRTEVTQRQWQAVMGYNPSRFRDPRRPVDSVSWSAAQEFIQKLNRLTGTGDYRLPSEAEWEYAARAGGVDSAPLGDYGWYNAVGGQGTHPVAKKRPNAWGLYDMAGNVWEWTLDCWHADYTGAPPDGRAWVDKTGDCAQRVVRGGGWNSDAPYLRATARGAYNMDMADAGMGFRLARFR